MPASPDQFVALMAAHQREVYRYIVALTPSTADADDVFQDTAMTLWREFERFEPGTSFAAWACKVAYYRVLAHRSKLSRDRHVFSDELIERLAERRAAMGEALASRREALDGCLRRLTPQQRELIDQRYSGKVAIRDLAGQTGRNVHTLYKTLDRIRRALAECVERRLAAEEAE